MFIYELEDLEDILDTLVFEDEPSIFNEKYALELVETALHLMDEFISYDSHIISEPNFCDILLDEIKEIFYIQMEDQIEGLYNGDDIEDDMNELLEDAFIIYMYTFYPDKMQNNSIQQFIEYNSEEINFIEEKIQQLREIPQPVQRTPEWYQFRWNLITASNAWKAFETQTTINQLIYEKCQPLKSNDENNDEEQIKMVNVNSPLHWGQKYEPLSILIYEHNYNTKVEDFGCIKHPIYSFLGASPDGINVDVKSERYGRMLEIKNVVSREITGIPKKEYWTQMQLQMEVCDLDECDFLETKFIEYPDTQSFYNDSKIDENGEKNLTLSLDNKVKGIILYFHTKEGKPFYIYKPLNILSDKDINIWEEAEVEKYESEPYNYIFLKFIYWKLEVLSCVLVLRNREWFKNNIGQLEKVWKIIEEENFWIST
jgi:putative phage-type endonuclease